MTQDKTPGTNRFDTGAELKRIRGDRTQQEFADLLDVGRNTVARYETNERIPDAEFLFKLNLLFGIDPSQVILGRKSGQLMGERETKLLDDYQGASEEDKRTIERMADLAAKSAREKKTKPT